MRRRELIPLLLVALLAAAGGAWVGTQWSGQPKGQPGGAASSMAPGQLRPEFTHGATDGRRVSARDFDGRVLLVNFWATWCEPCREEMPMLDALQDEYEARGLSVVGIALDDVQRARDFVEGLGVGYTILVGAGDVLATSRAWGNEAGLLPYSVLVDREGIVRWAFFGELAHEDLRARLEALL